MGETLTMIGVKLANVLAAAAGSFVSLNFFKDLTKTQRLFTFFGGLGVGAWGTEAICALAKLPIKAEAGIAIVLGLFSMSIVEQLIKLEWKDIFWGILEKFGVKRPQPKGEE